MNYETAQEACDNAFQDYGEQEYFDGKNCEDIDNNECSGWDGVSKRCECGNRRVYWEPVEDEKGKFYAVATAW